MPALNNIQNRILTQPDWQAVFSANLTTSQASAQRMPIVHVLGNASTFWAREFASWPPKLLPTAPNNSRTRSSAKTSSTSEAEDSLGLGRCIYFYAGRAFPVGGGVAFAFGPDDESKHNGSATPFDTGGIYFQKIFLNPSMNVEERAILCKSSIINLNVWRDHFATFFAAYFNPFTDYWEGRPWQTDPDGIFTDERNSWRAWTFEVRFQEPHDIANVEFWCAKEDDVESFYRSATNVLPAAWSADVKKFADRMLAPPQGTLEYCHVMELEIKNRVGL